jgi:hypothetical protein
MRSATARAIGAPICDRANANIDPASARPAEPFLAGIPCFETRLAGAYTRSNCNTTG